MPKEPIVAVGLLTQREVEVLGPGFERIWPLEDVPCFLDLLEAIDEAERSSGAAPTLRPLGSDPHRR